MKRIVIITAVVLAGLIPALGWEVGYGVHPKDGGNVVHMTGERLEFDLEALRYDDGSIIVRMLIPAGSELGRAPQIRLEIAKDDQILLWSKLDVSRNPDGSREFGFQIHESLVKAAYIGIPRKPEGEPAIALSAYKIPIAEYVQPAKKKAGSSQPTD